jgi:AcrR family transcriptional regulator
MKQNAMTEQAKLQRRDEFIAAARQLFIAQQRLPTVADIAEHTGLAKGTVYRYFQSKEHIFLPLLAADFAALFCQMEQLIEQLPASMSQAAEPFARGYLQLLQQSATLLPLLAMLNAVLEQNLPQQALLAFKQQLAQALETLGVKLAARYAELTPASACQLLLHSYALTLGLYQSTQLPPSVQALLQHAGLKQLQWDFATELTTAIRQQWAGAVQG